MADVTAAVAFALVLLAALIWAVTREDAKLRRQARRYLELELEGIEELRSYADPYPEEADTAVGFLREPDGRASDPDRVLHEDLERAREYTRTRSKRQLRTRSPSRGRGAECLL